MTISVVQSGQAGAGGGTWAVTLGSNTTANNTLFYVTMGVSFSGGPVSSSSPTLGGSSVTGAAKIASATNTNPTGDVTLTDIWMLPNIAGGQTACAVTVTGSSTINNVGLVVFEVSGLGTTPTVDQAYPTPSPPTTGNSGNTANTAINSGTTGAINFAPEIILGGASADQNMASIASGFTGLATGGDTNSWGGYQIATSSGGTYTWTQTAASNASWSSAIVTVYAAATAISGKVQPLATVPVARRRPSRAVVRFTPVVTVNTGHGPAGRAQPLAASLVAPRRKPGRAVVQFTPVTTTNAPAKPKPQHGTPSSDEARGWKRWLLWGP